MGTCVCLLAGCGPLLHASLPPACAPCAQLLLPPIPASLSLRSAASCPCCGPAWSPTSSTSGPSAATAACSASRSCWSSACGASAASAAASAAASDAPADAAVCCRRPRHALCPKGIHSLPLRPLCSFPPGREFEKQAPALVILAAHNKVTRGARQHGRMQAGHSCTPTPPCLSPPPLLPSFFPSFLLPSSPSPPAARHVGDAGQRGGLHQPNAQAPAGHHTPRLCASSGPAGGACRRGGGCRVSRRERQLHPVICPLAAPPWQLAAHLAS